MCRPARPEHTTYAADDGATSTRTSSSSKKKKKNLKQRSEKKKKSKTHKRLKERFLIRRNRTKRGIFEESLFFNLRTTIQQKTGKPTCVRLMLGSWREEKAVFLLLFPADLTVFCCIV